MLVGFPPFHSPNKRDLDKRIMNGVIRYPTDIDPDAEDLIEWLLAKNPADRPEFITDVKEHPYFDDVDWKKVANKQAIPPWIPDLTKWHAPKRFTSIPLSQVFLRMNKGKPFKSASANTKDAETPHFKTSIYAHDQKSNMVKRGYGNYREAEDELYLPGKILLFVHSFSPN